MNKDFINLNSENISDEHLCCIIRSRVIHPGVESKRAWLCERLKEGHVFRKLNEKATVFIEYAPLETAWTPIVGENYLYIYCLWVSGKYKGHGYGKALMNYCIEDAKLKGKSGVCMLGSVKQKAWLSDQSFAKEYGFNVVDTTNNGYQLLALSFDGTKPKFTDNAKKESIENKNLTIFYDMQCPYIYQNIEKLEQYCKENDIPISLNKIETLEQAKNLPSVFNNMAVFYKGIFKTVNLIDENYLKRIMKK
ncbi:MAG: GNAT family N-acetyltransferase [Pleomorphochaeta sp.]